METAIIANIHPTLCLGFSCVSNSLQIWHYQVAWDALKPSSRVTLDIVLLIEPIKGTSRPNRSSNKSPTSSKSIAAGSTYCINVNTPWFNHGSIPTVVNRDWFTVFHCIINMWFLIRHCIRLRTNHVILF